MVYTIRMIFVVATILALLTGSAAAQDWWSETRVGLKGAFAFGGELDQEWGIWNFDDDLEPTVGFTFFGLYPVWEYKKIRAHVGFQVGFGWYRDDFMGDMNIDRNFFMDMSPVLRGGYALLDDALEVYALFPVGLTISILSDEAEDNFRPGMDVEAGAGWNVGFLVGATYLVLPHLRVLCEMGWQGRGAT